MKYEELKSEIRDLGFEDDSAVSEYLDIINNAITRACKVIATTVKAPTGSIALDLSDETVYRDDGRYDLYELSKDSHGNVMFDVIDRVVDNLSSGGIKTFSDYDLEDGRTFVVSPSATNNLTIYYKERILPITQDTADDYKIQVAYPCEPLVALLSAHYVWLDDDERKAVMYWNEYDQLKQEILAMAFKPKARIIGGF